jgi:hypothetical protein
MYVFCGKHSERGRDIYLSVGHTAAPNPKPFNALYLKTPAEQVFVAPNHLGGLGGTYF